MSEILTAQTEAGRAALEDVMAHSERTDLSAIPEEWVRVLVEDNAPLSFVAIDPDRRIAYPKGEVRYAFLAAGATRTDRRETGCFRRVVEPTLDDLRNAGIPWVIGHMPYGLGRSLGFQVFSNHSCFVLRPEEIEQTLGGGRPEGMQGVLSIETNPDFPDDLLLVTDVRAETEIECIQALREAAWTARSNGKWRIVFEHPPAAKPGSTYPFHVMRQTNLMTVAMTCGARVRSTGGEHVEDGDKAEAEGAIPEDMIRLLDLAPVLERVVGVLDVDAGACPAGSAALDTEVGQATLTVDSSGCRAQEGIAADAMRVALPAEAVAQILIGYRSAATQAYTYQASVPVEAAQLLDQVFPRLWRITRNEEWIAE